MTIISVMESALKPRPILKWAGGKQALAPFLVERFPQDHDVYFEPFVGGGSVLLALESRRAVIGDRNDWLLDTFEAVRTDAGRVAKILDSLENTKEAYLRIRSLPHQDLDRFRRAAHLIYLNKTCFRGLFRVNRKGQFNVPYGDYDRRYYDPDNLVRVAEKLRHVEIRRGDFADCVRDATARDFIYFDPPYYRLGGYSDFNRYTPDQFREEDHARLADLCRNLDRRDIRWALSNSDTAFVRDLFRGFRVLEVQNRREINLVAGNRDVRELLITNYATKPLETPGGSGSRS